MPATHNIRIWLQLLAHAVLLVAVTVVLAHPVARQQSAGTAAAVEQPAASQPWVLQAGAVDSTAADSSCSSRSSTSSPRQHSHCSHAAAPGSPPPLRELQATQDRWQAGHFYSHSYARSLQALDDDPELFDREQVLLDAALTAKVQPADGQPSGSAAASLAAAAQARAANQQPSTISSGTFARPGASKVVVGHREFVSADYVISPGNQRNFLEREREWAAVAARQQRRTQQPGAQPPSGNSRPTHVGRGPWEPAGNRDGLQARAAPVTSWPIVQAPLDEATHECTGRTHEHRVCRYRNLVLWNGTLYYPTYDEHVAPPDVPLSWVGISPFKDQVLGSSRLVEVVHPDDLPFDWEDAPALELADALVWLLTYQDNYGHLLGEHGPTIHSVLCTYMNRCTFSDADLDNLVILLDNPEDDSLTISPPATLEMFQCFAKNLPVRLDDAFFADYPVVIRNLVAGIGPACRGFPWCRPGHGRVPLTQQMAQSWRRRLMDCTGFPHDVRASYVQPNVVIVNRTPSMGRNFLNLREMVAAVRAAQPHAHVMVRELEGESLQEQARIYLNASLVIQAHGAALGNMIFMPSGSCLLDLTTENNEDKHAWAYYMAADFREQAYMPIPVPPQRSVLMMSRVRASAAWRLLPSHLRHRILRDHVCPTEDEVNHMFDAFAACNFQWFLKDSNIIVNMTQLLKAVDLAMLHMRRNAAKVASLATNMDRWDLDFWERVEPDLPAEQPAQATAPLPAQQLSRGPPPAELAASAQQEFAGVRTLSFTAARALPD